MSRLLRLAILGVCATAAIAGGAAFAGASSPGVSKPTTIRVLLKHSVFQIVDNNGNKNIGDTFAYNAQMWNAGGNHRLGRVDGACTATTADDTLALCNVVYTFKRRGEISTTGVSPLSGVADTDPIVGGDGQFRNVRGEVDFGNSTKAIIKVTLRLRP
jgi:Dirigent-like protein